VKVGLSSLNRSERMTGNRRLPVR